MTIRTLNLGETEFAELITVLQAAEAQALAWVKAKHSTDAERSESLRRASICQMAYLQLEGITHVPAEGAPDWSAEPPEDLRLRGKLPQELMDDLNATVKEQ
jgi:hypothetical protein